MTGIKNINKAEVMALKDQVEYQDGQVLPVYSPVLPANHHIDDIFF